MLPSASQIVLFLGEDFIAVYNDAYAPTIGNKHPSALGRPAREHWAELWNDLEPLLQRVLKGGETVSAKDRPFQIERHGFLENVFFDISYSPIRDEAGTVRGVICIVSETTDRVLAQQALQQSQERLAFALEASGTLGTFDWHIKTDILYSDLRFAAMFGVPAKSADGGAKLSEYLHVIHPDDRERVWSAIQRTITSGTRYIEEYRLLGSDGSVRWVEARGECLYDAEGLPDRFPGAVVDITERKQAEATLGRVAAIVASSHDAILGIDLDTTITDWNEGATQLYGFLAEEVIGKPVTILLPQDRADEERAILRRIRAGERVEPYETKRLRKDGSIVDVSLTVSPVRDASGKIVGASKIARDISARKEAEKIQRVLNGELQHRVKNVLATVRAIAMQTFRDGTSKTARDLFESRLLSLARAHDLLTAEGWSGAEMSVLIADVLTPFVLENFDVEGPELRLSPEVVLAFSLALHELATNAAKYGALSVSSGRVQIKWTVLDDARRRLLLTWREYGGPRVEPPTRRGFGSRMIEGVLTSKLGGKVEITYEPTGVVCHIDALMPEDGEP
ncbi:MULTISPECIES: PAS domain S-box protein [unclassified Chelatococcus]|uniref:PAS domain-containing sensor histidine kinase n=1 Tax=unclassified Chelatococcus TaxID=2638111 RepID=UPI001BCD68B2|nr:MULTISPECIES: PAS domain S-box protein [unclassified Chelatococcus]MBS7700074.1 PAS domain S-box protein [Chelatococcus sp. YT9]MBX3556767.1 PAS domain S-box protein [Chelatococcus sp.]